MKAISLFSGVGGFDLGFEKAGIETVLQAEQDKHALAVLSRHWPHVEKVTDVRGVVSASEQGQTRRATEPAHGDGDRRGIGYDTRDGRAFPVGGVDLIFGGFPCQDISVAGRRAGLSGERSGLWFEFHRVLAELRPRWCVIENVPGLFSSNEGRDFAVILDGLDELGYGVAWRVLDAQHFGVPQRRRRVFIVGGPGDGTPAAAVLAVREGCAGHPQESGAQGEDVAYALTAGVRGTGDGHGNLWNSNYVANTLRGGSRGTDDPDRSTYIPGIVGALSDGAHHGGGLNGQDAYTGRIIAPTAGVRRLTPLECERLQGFPDGWTDGQADSHRYRQMGNAVCVPVAEWIGHRLVRVNELAS